MEVQRVEKQIIKPSNNYYQMIDSYCFAAKNLYNHANYIVRQRFCKDEKWVKYEELDKILRADTEYPDYKNMPTAQSAQQTLKLLDINWKSFFKAIKDWTKHKEKYTGRPKLPKYKKKDGRNILILTNQNVKLKENTLRFPRVFNGFEIKTKIADKENFVSFQQIRFIPKANHIVVEIVYKVELPEEVKDNGRYISIDIGVDNLATVTNNYGKQPYIINGKGLKSVNVYWNKQKAHYQEIAERMNNKKYTNRMGKLTEKRTRKIEDYMHKASRYIVEQAKKDDVSAIVIGKNKEWKQGSKMLKKVNQTFQGIPFARLIEMISYKAEEEGIKVYTPEESYTSGTSFLDKEMPIKENYNKSRRIYRGLFVSNEGIKINADVNGSLQIMKKVFPKANANGIEDVMLHPFVVNVFAV